MRSLFAIPGALALAACAPEAPEPAAKEDKTAAPLATPTRANLPEACPRDEQGQVACLIEAFALEKCDDATALGSAFRDTAEKGTYQHSTVYGLSDACLADLREKARLRGLADNGQGGFAGEIASGYSETLIIALQTSKDGTVIEWGREKT